MVLVAEASAASTAFWIAFSTSACAAVAVPLRLSSPVRDADASVRSAISPFSVGLVGVTGFPGAPARRALLSAGSSFTDAAACAASPGDAVVFSAAPDAVPASAASDAAVSDFTPAAPAVSDTAVSDFAPAVSAGASVSVCVSDLSASCTVKASGSEALSVLCASSILLSSVSEYVSSDRLSVRASVLTGESSPDSASSVLSMVSAEGGGLSVSSAKTLKDMMPVIRRPKISPITMPLYFLCLSFVIAFSFGR